MNVYEKYSDLIPFGDSIYYINGEWMDTVFKRRMTVIRLNNGNLVIHNAFRMHDQDLNKLNQLGKVSYILVPNSIHFSDADFFSKKYPDAKVLVPIACKNKMSKKLKVDGCYDTDWTLTNEIVCIPFMNNMIHEHAFIHLKSKTLILTDMLFNIKSSDFPTNTFSQKFEKYLLGTKNDILDKAVPSNLTKLVVSRNKSGLRKTLNEIIKYDFDKIIINHGEVISNNGKNILIDGYKYRYGENII